MTFLDTTSRLLRIGVVNSGMFELLELNMDVPAIHLIGRNNVGKTSLIALLQFLYFHDIGDMWFPKSNRESLAFYFRREGAYILFEVRTLTGLRRTIGVYGEGPADSRRVFVFNGAFRLADFLDERQRVVPLAQAQQKFFDRDFYLYPRFEDYERALLGNHTVDLRNVQMFELPPEHFRQLRRLLQGLLRLSHLTADEVRNFIIRVVELSGSVKTTINIAHDFQERHREIKTISLRLRELQHMEPAIRNWASTTADLQQVQHEHAITWQRLYHTGQRYIVLLRTRLTEAESAYQVLQQQRSALEHQSKELIRQETMLDQHLKTFDDIIGQFERLIARCSRYDEASIVREHEELTQRRREIESVLDRVQSETANDLRRKLQALQRQRQNLQHQLDRRSLDAVWSEAGFSAEHRTLLTFLVSQNVLGLPADDVLSDRTAFLGASRQAVACLDEDGVFQGFGLRIPRATWQAAAVSMSPIEQLEDIDRQIQTIQQRLTAAEDRRKTEADLDVVKQQIAAYDQIIQVFRQLRDIQSRHESAAACHAAREDIEEQLASLQHKQADVDRQIESLTRDAREKFAQVENLSRELREAIEHHKQDQPFDTACPLEVLQIADDDLKEHDATLRGELRQQERDLERLQKRLDAIRADLDAWYDRDATDVPFDDWVERNLDIADKIDRIHDQLRESYANLITLVRGELDKLSQAFGVVQSRLADLNNLIKKVNISNIDRIEVRAQESDLVEAVRRTSQVQLELFTDPSRTFLLEKAQEFVDQYLSERLRSYGRAIHLRDMFNLQFVVHFVHGEETITDDIHRFESNGTEIGVKIVLYLGMIRLLQGRRKFSARIPFFLDEVNSIDSVNLKQIIAYCQENNFLPVFASPDIRKDISHNYIFRRDGERSYLFDTIVITDEEQQVDDETPTVDHNIA